MAEPLDQSIAHLRAQSLHLNEVTDHATAAVRRVELFLNQECRLGVAVHVPVTADAAKRPTLTLGYARNGDRYRIVVRSLAYADDEGDEAAREEQAAWSACPRAVKLDTFQHLPALLTALQAQVADVVKRSDAALAAAQRIADALGPAPAAEAGADDEERDDGDRCEGKHRGHHHGHHGHHGHHHDERERGERGERERGDDERGHGRHKHGGGWGGGKHRFHHHDHG